MFRLPDPCPRALLEGGQAEVLAVEEAFGSLRPGLKQALCALLLGVWGQPVPLVPGS